MPVLSITAAQVAEIARLDIGDATVSADCTAVLTDEQPALEAMLTSAALADPVAAPLLRRYVAKLCAAEVLDMRSRAAGGSGDMNAAALVGVDITHVPDHAAALRAEAWAMLAPYVRPALASLIPSNGPLGALQSAEAEKQRVESVTALLTAGTISADEARAQLGISGAAPSVDVAATGPERAARVRAISSLIVHGNLRGDEAWIGPYLGLPDGTILTTPAPVLAVVTSGSSDGLTRDEQTRLFGRREADRFGITADNVGPGWIP